MTTLADRVVVLARADDPQAAVMAHSLAAQGASLVLTGVDQTRLGALAASLRDVHAVRVAVFAGDPAEEALAEMVAELFPG
ncbi:MAG: hypothetical protein SGJ13_10115 [Actinomycetota bacterium]|nr:hypothetical protein [Actinomycetota bacterium]